MGKRKHRPATPGLLDDGNGAVWDNDISKAKLMPLNKTSKFSTCDSCGHQARTLDVWISALWVMIAGKLYCPKCNAGFEKDKKKPNV